jgi:UDP-N-acetylmuramyl pentapeptide phosphotransferase/UDP-N-acetylglucosamine-1-phosphate transferase
MQLIYQMAPFEGSQPGSALASTASPVVLVLGAFAFGFADDVFGTGADRGFGGHLRALSHGRLTTGGLKLLGIGLLAAFLVGSQVPIDSAPGVWQWILSVMAIALTANLVNLTDLRPGRALKVYSLLAVVCALYVLLQVDVPTATQLLIVLLGPVVAVWRFDLGERAMLGDAGANAAGALIGWVAAAYLQETWQLVAYVAVVLALNLASERVSFSRVIEGNRALSWLDGLGRLDDRQGGGDGAPTASEEELGEKKSPI